MQNQQIIYKINQLEEELKKIKTQIQKKPVKGIKFVWEKINFLENQIDEAKGSAFDFDIDKFVDKQDISSWK